MLNKSLERYKELYSKYVNARVGLHNYHITFINNLGKDSTVGVRKHIIEMEKLEKDLRKACLDAYREHVAWVKAEGKKKKQQKYRNTSGLKKRKVPDQDNNNDNN